MKKFTLKNKIVACGILGNLSLGLLMGAGQQLHFSDIDNGVEEIILNIIPENMDDDIYDLIVLEQGEEHFEEILDIVSKYGYETNEFSSIPRSGISFSGDEPFDGFSLTTYDGEKEELTSVMVVECGALNINDHRYNMQNADLMVAEIYEYVNQYPEFYAEKTGN